ncbi:6854_t:CDS:2, partial [Ambispora leptoticha]
MSIPDETLRKVQEIEIQFENQLHVLFELQNRLVENNRQLSAVKAQIAGKEREKKIAELTKRELLALLEGDSGDGKGKNAAVKDVTTYKSVGKAFFRTDLDVLLEEHNDRISKATSELSALEQQKKYLERNISESQTGLREKIALKKDMGQINIIFISVLLTNNNHERPSLHIYSFP